MDLVRPEMDQLADADARLGADLRQAIGRDELFVLYQPIVELPPAGSPRSRR